MPYFRPRVRAMHGLGDDLTTDITSILGDATTVAQTYYTDQAAITVAQTNAANAAAVSNANLAAQQAAAANAAQASSLNSFMPILLIGGGLILVISLAKKK